MSYAKAYLEKDDKSNLLVESVASIRPLDGECLLRTLFGEQKEVKAIIKEIDFLNSTITLKALNTTAETIPST